MGALKEAVKKFRRPRQMDLEKYLEKTRSRGLSDDGKFIPDAVPMAPPIGYKKQPSMVEIVRNMVRSEKLAEAARNAGVETFEESEDFDIGDDGEDLTSGFENDFDPPIAEIREAIEEAATSSPPANPIEPVLKTPTSVPGAEEPPKGGSET